MVFVAVLMAAPLGHHALQVLLGIGFARQVQEADGPGPVLSDRFQDIVHPDVIFPAHIDKEVTVLDQPDILGGGLIGVDLLPRLEQHMDIRAISSYIPGKIILGKDGRHDLQARSLVWGP